MDRNQAKKAVHDAIGALIRERAASPDQPIETLYANHVHIESSANDVCVDFGEAHQPKEGGSVIIPRVRIYFARPFYSKLVAMMTEHSKPGEIEPWKKDDKQTEEDKKHEH